MASAWAAHVSHARQMGELAQIDAGKKPLGVLADECKTRRWENREPATCNRYVRTWNLHINPYLGTTPVVRVTAPVIEDWLATLKRQGVSADGRRRALSLLRSILARGIEWGYVRGNQAASIPMPTADPKPSVRPLAPAQVEAIVRQMDRPEDQVLTRLLAYAGLRPGEALALTDQHVKKKTLLIEQAVSNGRIKATKTRQVRSVDLLAPLGSELREWMLATGRRGLLFPRFDGEPWRDTDYQNWTRRIFAPAARDAGITATPYTLRHSFASLLIHAGEPVTYVAAQLGHAPTMTLDTYAHVFADLERGVDFDPAKAIAEALSVV